MEVVGGQKKNLLKKEGETFELGVPGDTFLFFSRTFRKKMASTLLVRVSKLWVVSNLFCGLWVSCLGHFTRFTLN